MISISLRKLLTTRFRFELCKKETESEKGSVFLRTARGYISQSSVPSGKSSLSSTKSKRILI